MIYAVCLLIVAIAYHTYKLHTEIAMLLNWDKFANEAHKNGLQLCSKKGRYYLVLKNRLPSGRGLRAPHAYKLLKTRDFKTFIKCQRGI